MTTFSAHSLPDLIEQLQGHGADGVDIVRRLAEADRLIAQAGSSSLGFTHASQRYKARLMGAEGRRLFNKAMSDATYILSDKPER